MKELAKFIIDERTGLKYELVGDYYFIFGDDEPEEQRHIGIWGQRHGRYLKQNKKAIYAGLLISGELPDYLADIGKQAEEMFSQLVKQMAECEGVTEPLLIEQHYRIISCAPTSLYFPSSKTMAIPCSASNL